MFKKSDLALKSKIILTFILGFVIVITNGQQSNYEIVFTKAECFYNSSHIKSFECAVRNDGDRVKRIDGYFVLNTTFDAFTARIILIGYRRNMPRVTIFDQSLNACVFFESVQKQKLLSIFLVAMKRFMNVLPKCPFRKDFNYTVTGFHYDRKVLSIMYLPEGEFESTTQILYRKEFVASAKFWGRVVHSKNINPKRSVN